MHVRSPLALARQRGLGACTLVCKHQGAAKQTYGSAKLRRSVRLPRVPVCASTPARSDPGTPVCKRQTYTPILDDTLGAAKLSVRDHSDPRSAPVLACSSSLVVTLAPALDCGPPAHEGLASRRLPALGNPCCGHHPLFAELVSY